jgi:hypothetical protein
VPATLPGAPSLNFVTKLQVPAASPRSAAPHFTRTLATRLRDHRSAAILFAFDSQFDALGPRPYQPKRT